MEANKRNDEVEIDLKEIMSLILNKASIIILVAICGAILCYTQAKANQRLSYTASTKMYILSRNNQEETIGSNTQLVTSILNDYKALITSKDILEEVIRELNLPKDYNMLASQISITIPQEATVVTIYVTDYNPIEAMQIANTVRDVMGRYMKNTMGIELFDIIEKANLPDPERRDSSKRNAVLGGVIGACLVMGILIGRYLLDDTIKKTEEIEAKLGLSVLASIPISEKKVKGRNSTNRKKRKKRGESEEKGDPEEEESERGML